MTDLIFLDTETTGLDSDKHQIWEIAWAVNDGPINLAHLLHDLDTADPEALRLNGYHDRIDLYRFEPYADLRVREVIEGNTLVCANPPFDRGFMKARWQAEPWHYRSVDISSYAMPILDHSRPMGLATVGAELRELGYDIPFNDHSAMGDVAALRASYQVLETISKRMLNAIADTGGREKNRQKVCPNCKNGSADAAILMGHLVCATCGRDYKSPNPTPTVEEYK